MSDFKSHRPGYVIRLLILVWASPLLGQNLTVLSTTPARHALNVPRDTGITIQFDRPLATATINPANVRVWGRSSGPVQGTYSFSNGNRTLTFSPVAAHRYAAGENVFVNLSHSIAAADATTLRAGGYAWQFTAVAARATMQFNQIAVMSNRSNPNVNTHLYGAAACDLNRDGFIDLTTINEDSHDLRVFMNRADGTGLYGPVLLPPLPIGVEASPNEPGDFNNDGLVDVAVAASISSSVWIALGRGDGTFNPAQEVAVGSEPHGLAALDANGDGAIDLATSNFGGNNVGLMLNNGNGVFAPATLFEGGGDGEYAITAADMNNDGIFDLIVGAQNSQTIIVHLGNGDGTFTALPPRPAGGAVWKIVAGDVNGDGNMDIAAANGSSNSGSILLGDGTGGLGPPMVVPTAAHVVGTALGDLDGDGDLDWVLTSFSGGEWRIFTNNGAGVFTFNQSFVAQSNPSCAIILDIDNDGDLDLALTDEVADTIKVMKNRGPLVNGDMNCDGRIDGGDVPGFVRALLDPAGYAAAFPHCVVNNADMDHNLMINSADVPPFVGLLLNG